MVTRRRGVAVVLAVANQKGGVGRTTMVLELARALRRRGLRVLAIDADPRHDLTEQLQPAEAPELTLNDVLAGDPERGGEVAEGSMVDAVAAADQRWGGVEYVPAEIALARREYDRLPGRELRVRQALSGELGRWDWVLIDCPGSVDQLTVTALVAADLVLIVTEPRKASVEALATVTATVATVKRHLNERLQLAGIVVNRHNDRVSDQKRWLEALRDDYGNLLMTPILEEREVVPKAHTERMPLEHFGTTSADIVAAFDQIAAELVSAARKGRN